MRLERSAEARVRLEECRGAPGRTIPDTWEDGPSEDAAVMLLSGEAVPERADRSRWASVLDHVERNAEPPIAFVLAGDCRYPPLLERAHFHRWQNDSKGVMRALERWLIDLRPAEPPPFEPARLAWFEGREQELEYLWDALVDNAGLVSIVNPAAGSGKSSLAQEFARSASGHFRETIWINASNRMEISITCDLASRLGMPLDGPLEMVLAGLNLVFEERRLLIVLDGLTGRVPFVPPAEGRTSMLVTTRKRNLSLPAGVKKLRIESGTQPLIEPPPDASERRLWLAASVCRHGDFRLALAARVAGLEDTDARNIAESLVSQRHFDPLDAARTRFRLSGCPAPAEEFRRAHAEALNELFLTPRGSTALWEDLLPEAEAAFRWSVSSDWALAISLGRRTFAFLKQRRRLHEAVELYKELISATGQWGDRRTAEECAWELSWLVDNTGELRHESVGGEQIALDFG